MADVSTARGALLAIDFVGVDLERLASAVILVGGAAKANGVGPSDGGGIEILGEVIGERVADLRRLVERGLKSERPIVEASHG